MKIIDLLNKIANGEELPKEIKYGGATYLYNLLCEDYEDTVSGDLLFGDRFDANKILTDELEILDKEDEFEDIEELKLDGDFGGDFLINDEGNRCHISSHDKTIVNRINKVIKNQKKIIERLQHENSEDNV